MQKILLFVISILIIGMTFIYIDPITNYLKKYINNEPVILIEEKNAYAKNNSYLYVSLTEDFIPLSYQDLLNIIYTSINSGWKTFTFYCPEEYSKCLTDIEEISGDQLILTHINNYVHPFNSFTNINTSISDSGEITLNISYLYSEDKINKINTKTDQIINELLNDNMTTYEKIKTLHDYIINNSKYDVERNENNDSSYDSYTAYGPLFEGYATCNGYTDLMAIFLSKLNIDNYKIATTPQEIGTSNTGHIWNAVYYKGEWLHVDLTWDDPVSSNNQDYLFHTYFLVTTEEMKKADTGETVVQEHNFNPLYYLEFN